MTAHVLMTSRLGELTLHRRGKVRDVYALDDALLIVATDRISAFDVVLPTGIPDKGKILTQISLYWFTETRSLMPNHVIASRVDDYPETLAPFSDQLERRSMLVKKTRPVPFECVVRGYLYGSGWEDYQRSGAVCGITLPSGLQLAAKLPEPLFTPATKADTGHDVNVSEKDMTDRLGADLSRRLKEISLELYRFGASRAENKGILIADTKFEFGLVDGDLLLIDEVLTPDSSRFWPRESYRPGKSQPSYDKQFVRDYLKKVGWDKSPPAPELPPDVVSGTRERYRQAFETLTGKSPW